MARLTPAFLRPYSRPASRESIQITGADGCYVTDSNGKRYIDALASLWYCNVGHGRTEIIDAISAQMKQLDAFHTFELFSNPPSDQLADLLAELAPIPDARVAFTSSGSEAVDSAIKYARLAHRRAGRPERTIIVSRKPSYHGVTYGGMSLTGMDPVREGFGPFMDDVRRVKHDDLDEVASLFEAEGDRIAAVIAEPVIAGGGVYPATPEYFRGLRELCDRHGAFLIADEVVCGFGRTGTWWGSETLGVEPDLITFAKAVTSGYLPLGGVIMGRSVMEPLEADEDYLVSHGHTYSGHPAACAAALASTAIIEREGLCERAKTIAGWFEPRLKQLVESNQIASYRGTAAVWAAVLEDGVSGLEVRDEMIERGVIVRVIRGSIVALCPPLVISEEETDRVVTVIEESIQAVKSRR